jgi:riboflavin kinase/FMN adenylyltransferase
VRVHHHASDFPRSAEGTERTVLTIGTFDGVHMGHRAVLRQLKEVAKRHQASTTLLSFHPHPRVVLDPEHHGLKLLNTLDERERLLASTGLDHLVLHPFTHELSTMSPLDYARSLLAETIQPIAVVIGDDHRFGRHRSGNFDTLKTLGEAFGFEVEALDAHCVNEVRVSSTKVREALRAGHIDEANTWLGSPYPTSGTVVHGHARGRELGFPTANLDLGDPLKLLPAEGVYAVWCQTPEGSWLPGMANVGRRPTLHRDSETSLEVHVIGGQGHWYEKTLHVRWMHWMRGEVKFESTEALKMALAQDRDRALSLLGSSTHPPF